jgi:anthranilate/para-aminobenzoate synthase component I
LSSMRFANSTQKTFFGAVVQAVPARRRFKEYRGEPRIRSDVSQQEYEQMVEISKRYIRAGDIFQVVPSRRFTVENPPDAFDVYRVLRSINPSPYLYYLQNKHCRIAGASPEMLVRGGKRSGDKWTDCRNSAAGENHGRRFGTGKTVVKR